MWTKLLELMGRASTGQNAIAITPSDSTTYQGATRPTHLVIGGAGNLAYQGDNGVTVTVPVTAGQIYPFSPFKVMAETTATGIVGHY